MPALQILNMKCLFLQGPAFCQGGEVAWAVDRDLLPASCGAQSSLLTPPPLQEDESVRKGRVTTHCLSSGFPWGHSLQSISGHSSHGRDSRVWILTGLQTYRLLQCRMLLSCTRAQFEGAVKLVPLLPLIHSMHCLLPLHPGDHILPQQLQWY